MKAEKLEENRFEVNNLVKQLRSKITNLEEFYSKGEESRFKEVRDTIPDMTNEEIKHSLKEMDELCRGIISANLRR